MAGPDHQNRRSRSQKRPVGALLLICAVLAAGAVWRLLGSSGPDTSERGGQAATDSSNRPTASVVIFLIDTLRADRLGTYGYSRMTSPQMDALATRGVVFEQCNAPAPWTLPSVVSLLTSTFPCEHGVVVDGQKTARSLEPLAWRLKRVGYATASFYANAYAGVMSGLDRGFDHRLSKPAISGEDVGPWLDGLGGRPFFLYIHNIEPHNPYNAPDRLVQLFGRVPPGTKHAARRRLLQYRQLTRVDFAAGRPVGTTDNTAEQDRAMRRIAELQDDINVLYDAAVRQADENLGSVIEALRRRGLWDQTLFIVLSDHGEEFGERGGWQHDQSVYEELVRVPLIVRFPGGRFAGGRISEVVTLVDILPTIFDYLGRRDLSSGCRGRSLVPLIRGEPLGGPEEPIVTSVRINRKKYYRPYRQTRGDVNVVVRRGAWKGIWNVDVQTFELYDLSRDPAERSSATSQEPELAATMHRYAQDWLERCRLSGGQATPSGVEGLDEDTLESLRSLGYVD